MVEWTPVLTAAVAGVTTAFAGWYGARSTAAASVRQVEAENERLREQHREDHLRNRQGTYHRFLTADREMARTLGTEFGADKVEAINALYAEWVDLSMGVALFGAEPVARAARALMDEYAAVGTALDETVDADTVAAVWTAARDRINAARDAVLIAMREDVGPRV